MANSGPIQAFPAGQIAQRLGRQLRKLGVVMHLFDTAGNLQSAPAYEDEFCSRLCQSGQHCQAAMLGLAQRVGQEEHSLMAPAPSGCCLLCVPIRRRRKLIGSAVGCFPTLDTPASEELTRACSLLQLDATYMQQLCRRLPCHAASEAPYLMQVLEWLLEDEQAKDVAGEELSTLSTNLANTYEELSLVYRISGSMKVTQSATKFFEYLCHELLEVMQLEASAVVLYPRSEQGGSEQVVWEGPLPLTHGQILQMAKRYLSGRLYSGGQAMIDNRFSEHAGALAAKVPCVQRVIAVPLMSADHCNGVVIGFNKISGDFDSVDLKLISSISSQAGVFLENNHLFQDLQDLLMGLLHALTASIDAKDPYTSGHSRRVAMVSRKLAELCGLESRRVERVYLAGLLHDVGKIGMPETVLCKAGKLTDEEFAKIRRHPEIGSTILGGIRQMADILPAVLSHHERLDGKGYPRRLQGREIPLEALIVGLADSFDAMTSNRTYRRALPIEVVATEVRRCSGTQFDPRLVELLLGLDLEKFLTQLWQGSNDLKEAAHEYHG